MKIPFVGPSATARSLNANAERSVNCFLEMNRDNPPRPVALYGTPGTVLRATLGASPVRGALKLKSGLYAYWVAGNTVYRMDTSYAVVSCGTIGTSSGQVGMATNGTETLIVDGQKGWLVTGTTLAEIVDVDFPDGVSRCTYQDGYFLVTGDGSQRFYWNETPGSGSAWNGLDFASAEGSPDNTVGIISDHRELWLFGSETAEIWINTGDADAPFQRSGNTFVEQGTAAAGTVCSMNNTVYWLGASKDGQGIVFRAEGYSPVRISDHGLEEAIRGYSTISDAFAYCYTLAGHSFYVLTFPTADATWLYDASTDRWFEWLWRNPANNEFHRHRSNCCVFFNGEHLVGDWESGKVYALDLDTYTDNGDPIRLLRRTQAMTDENARLFFEEVQIDMETGVANGDCANPLVMLRYSNDGGHTWSAEKQKSIGQVGQYGARVKFGPSGSGRNRAWELSITDPVKRAVFGASARVSKGI